MPVPYSRNEMKTVIGFSRGLMSLPMPWPVWLGLLVAVNSMGPIYFIEGLEGKVVLAAFLAGAMLMMAIFASKGFVRLLGIGHIFWIPMVPWLWTRLDQVGLGNPVGYWVVSVMIMNSISLVIDAIDLLRYLKGDRQPYVGVAD